MDVGIENQLKSFSPRGATPGFNRGLASGGQPSISQSTANYFQGRINTIKTQLKKLKANKDK